MILSYNWDWLVQEATESKSSRKKKRAKKALNSRERNQLGGPKKEQ